ncbi:MAG: sugar phosphate isomerase/epimerase, partial [Candidatus Bathyarchaeota archaeon]|nr:sugar phosphate isomerase/epimerase [Candidatus Bathyarchaeota archaeon]
MIKIGCAAYSYRDYLKDGKMSYEDFTEEAHSLGLDGVELTLYWIPSEQPTYFRNLKRIGLVRGLSISGAGIRTNFCTPDASEREKAVKSVEKGLDFARELGAPCLRVFAGYIPEGHTVEDAVEWTVQALKRCADIAEDRGIVIAMENHGGVTAKADNVIEIVEGVGSPWVRVNLDLGNYRESTYEEIARTLPYAVHAHAKVSVAGNGELDYHKVAEILQNGRYNGFLSIEYEEKEDPKTGIPRFAK